MRTKLRTDLSQCGLQPSQATDPLVVIRDAYDRGESDEFIKPIVIEREGAPRRPLRADRIATRQQQFRAAQHDPPVGQHRAAERAEFTQLAQQLQRVRHRAVAARQRADLNAVAFDLAHEDPKVGAIILTGAGDLAFCSGGDQKVRGHAGYIGEDGVPRLNVLDLQKKIRSLPKPVVAMVAGYAIGGGHVLHIVCDLTIAADNARFGQTGPKVGSFDGGLGSISEIVDGSAPYEPRGCPMQAWSVGCLLEALQAPAAGIPFE